MDYVPRYIVVIVVNVEFIVVDAVFIVVDAVFIVVDAVFIIVDAVILIVDAVSDSIYCCHGWLSLNLVLKDDYSICVKLASFDNFGDFGVGFYPIGVGCRMVLEPKTDATSD